MLWLMMGCTGGGGSTLSGVSIVVGEKIGLR